MKMTLTLLFAVAALTTSFAQGRSNNNKHSNGTYSNNGQYENNQNNNYQNSALVVNANSQNGFTVSIDNGNTSPSNSNNVRFRSISSGNHLVTVSEFRSSILGRQVPRVLYNSTITFKPGIETVLTFDNNGTVNITERQLSRNGNGNNGNNGNGKAKKYKKNKYPHDNRNHDKQKNHGNDDDDRKDD